MPKSPEIRPELPSAGKYEVLLRWRSQRSRSSRAPIQIHAAGGAQERTVNQKGGGQSWESLGEFNLKPGALVVFGGKDNPGGRISFDALKLVRKSVAAPPPPSYDRAKLNARVKALIAQVKNGKYVEAHSQLLAEIDEESVLPMKQKLQAAAAVVQVFVSRDEALQKSFQSEEGQKVRVLTERGKRKGKIQSVTAEGVTIESTVMINGQVRGTTKYKIEYGTLTNWLRKYLRRLQRKMPKLDWNC